MHFSFFHDKIDFYTLVIISFYIWSMHTLEPYFGWRNLYTAESDKASPFFGNEYNEFHFEASLYDHCVHPQWDDMGSNTLYIKILFADYKDGFLIVEFLGEWNDAINNDVMYLKRNIIDHYLPLGFNKFLLIGENVFNFHGSDDEYYAEWFEELEEGWIVAMGFQDHVCSEFQNFGIDTYLFWSEELDFVDWRTMSPKILMKKVDQKMKFLL